MKDLSLFMQVYMYELEQFLNQRHNEIQNVSFQSDEANTDRPLKESLKSVIETLSPLCRPILPFASYLRMEKLLSQ